MPPVLLESNAQRGGLGACPQYTFTNSKKKATPKEHHILLLKSLRDNKQDTPLLVFYPPNKILVKLDKYYELLATRTYNYY